MTRSWPARGESESGVVLIIVACCMIVLIGMMAIAIDASYGFVQNRRAQNASDFAAFAAAQELKGSYYCDGLTQPTTQQVLTVIQYFVDHNDASLGSAWQGQFLDSQGKALQFLNSQGQLVSTFSSSNAPAFPPNGACGVNVSATPTWPPFFAGIFGIHKVGGYAVGSVGPKTTKTVNVGIVALNKMGPHEVLGGGTGNFDVSGDIFLDTNVSNNPWSSPDFGLEWDDAIDAKTNSNLTVNGTIFSNNGADNGLQLWPLDTCFQRDGLVPSGTVKCIVTGGVVSITYNAISNNWPQFNDPLAASPPDPLTNNIGCPGAASVLDPPIQNVSGVMHLSPGVYDYAVDLSTSSAAFDDCPGGYTGVFSFEDGLSIDPPSGDSVTGNNVVISTKSSYPMADNVPGSVNTQGMFVASGGGNGAPCLPAATMTSAASGNGTPQSETNDGTDTPTQCTGTNPPTYGVVAYDDQSIKVDPTMTGTGNNFSLMIGGAGSVTLTGPTSGAYGGTNGFPGLVLYQDPQTPANYGFNAEPGDAATIQINGVVYNASLPFYGTTSPQDFWDGFGGGIPFYAGGTLQTGYGAGWPASPGPTPSSGTVTLTGTAIVDDFNTDGGTSIDIVGEPYTLPGGGNLSLIG